jgi:hypothetical protein
MALLWGRPALYRQRPMEAGGQVTESREPGQGRVYRRTPASNAPAAGLAAGPASCEDATT